MYRTALRKRGPLSRQAPGSSVEIVQRVEFDRGVVFKHDLSHGLPREYREVEAVYCEVPFRGGYEGDQAYTDFISVVASIYDTLGVPTIVAGPRAIEKAGEPHRKLDEYQVVSSVIPLYAWGWDGPLPDRWDKMLIMLSGHFESIGDPVCGFGNTGLVFALRGKGFVMSDVNAVAVSVTAKRIEEALRRQNDAR